MAPYDCENLSEDDDLAGLPFLTCVPGGPQWWQLGRQVGWSFFSWLIIYILCRVVEKKWQRVLAHKVGPGWLHQWLEFWVGDHFHRPKDDRLEIFLEASQLIASSTNIWIWVRKTYTLKESGSVAYALEFICVFFNLAHGLFRHVKSGFDRRHCMSPDVIIDCVTITPIVLQAMPGGLLKGSWLTLSYLRAYQQLFAFKQLAKFGLFESVFSDLTISMIVIVRSHVLILPPGLSVVTLPALFPPLLLPLSTKGAGVFACGVLHRRDDVDLRGSGRHPWLL